LVHYHFINKIKKINIQGEQKNRTFAFWRKIFKNRMKIPLK
jgi:hypothetical protein